VYKLSEVFKKQGGWSLIKRYYQGGVLPIAITQFLLLGKSRVALEQLRLTTQLKISQKLKRKYFYVLDNFEKEYNQNLTSVSSNKVWVCWFQGIENAPILVKKCYESLKKNLTNREIILITAENMLDYVQFPNHIMDKWKSGAITHTHMTDLLRLELLIAYGGTWIDATVYCSREEKGIPAYYFDSDLFVYQCLKPGRDGHSYINSSWYINAKSNNRILMAVRSMCHEYWKNNKSLKEYFLFHCFMAIVLNHFEEDWKNIIPICNSIPHILLLRLFEPYNEKIIDATMELTPFHKLSYKFSEDKFELKGTYYEYITSDD